MMLICLRAAPAILLMKCKVMRIVLARLTNIRIKHIMEQRMMCLTSLLLWLQSCRRRPCGSSRKRTGRRGRAPFLHIRLLLVALRTNNNLMTDVLVRQSLRCGAQTKLVRGNTRGLTVADNPTHLRRVMLRLAFIVFTSNYSRTNRPL